MATVIKLGGCNGSGKSTLARAFMEFVTGGAPTDHWVDYKLLSGKKTKVFESRYSNADIFVLGKYESACGGMDTISDKHDRFTMVKNFAQRKDAIVLFEGLITGKTYGALGELSEQRGMGTWLYAFMDTPWDTCVGRVLERRWLRGNSEPFDPERTMRSTFNSLQRLEEKLKNGTLPPHPTFRISHKLKPATAARQLLNKALELHHAR